MINNPYLDCRAEGDTVVSSHWHLKAADAAQAKRIVEIIQCAYSAGRHSVQSEVRVLLGLDGWQEER